MKTISHTFCTNTAARQLIGSFANHIDIKSLPSLPLNQYKAFARRQHIKLTD